MKYTIKAGDSLIQIAKEYSVVLSDILALNNIVNPNKIQVGQVIEIPDRKIEIPKPAEIIAGELDQKADTLINYLEGKKLKKQLDTDSKNNIRLIIETCLNLGVKDLRMISYVLATAFWESNFFRSNVLKPVEEIGRGRYKPYGIPYAKTGKIYYGRGFVQLTWFSNYKTFTNVLQRLGYDLDLVLNPEKVLDPKISALVLVIGMRDGKFTGTDLDDHFNVNESDWYNARRIINGTDKAVIIKDIAQEIYYIIK